MTYKIFDPFYKKYIAAQIEELKSNNSLIKVNHPQDLEERIFDCYQDLNRDYKSQIFNKEQNALLDRHKIASCLCGAILMADVFNKTGIIKQLKETKSGLEAYFFYVNELLAFISALKCMGLFMQDEYDKQGDLEKRNYIIENFPVFPKSTQNKVSFLHSTLFNLSQVKIRDNFDYDKYAYATIFFFIEDEFCKAYLGRPDR